MSRGGRARDVGRRRRRTRGTLQYESQISKKDRYPSTYQRTEVAFTEAWAPLPDAAAEWEPGKAGGTTTSYVR